MKTNALDLNQISKRFGNLQALSRVSFKLRSGTVHTLLGENGAGKSTLMRVAFGMVRPDSGEIRIHDKSVSLKSPADAIKLGIGMVHQHFMLVPSMTVAENIELGGKGLFRESEASDRIHALAKETGLSLDPHARVHSLSIAAQQRLEIIKALSRQADILILDEPTAVLSPREGEDLLTIIRRLSETGRSIVLITHKLRDAERYSDDVSVLRHGRLVLSSSVGEVSRESLTRAMLGDSPAENETSPAVRGDRVKLSAEAVIQLDHVAVEGKSESESLYDVNFSVRAGEIVGIAALDGAASALLRVVAGRQKAKTGRMTAPLRIGFVPEDRQHEALIPDFRLFENVALKDSGDSRGRISWFEIRNKTEALIHAFDIRANSVDVQARELSGGNQQKLVLARELSENPTALIADNPTWGLDIQAADSIHTKLRTAALNGCAVVFYSSDIDEIAELADRAFVVRDQTLVNVDDLTPESIGAALLGSRPSLSSSLASDE